MALEDHVEEVPGKKGEDLFLFTLSTCGWCRKTKDMLRDMGVGYRYVDVDLLEGDARNEAIGQLERWNPSRSFPTVVVNNDRCIVGFQEDKIREAAGDAKA